LPRRHGRQEGGAGNLTGCTDERRRGGDGPTTGRNERRRRRSVGVRSGAGVEEGGAVRGAESLWGGGGLL
jgi:hypothetical protein